ncbi:MAG: Hint domain-containing protein [Hyphomicrobium sp.]
MSGTHIATPAGHSAIEELSIGDVVTTMSAEPMPIKWIGRTSFERADGLPWSQDVAPVRISRGALGGGMPARDLYVSEGALHLRQRLPYSCKVPREWPLHYLRHSVGYAVARLFPYRAGKNTK